MTVKGISDAITNLDEKIKQADLCLNSIEKLEGMTGEDLSDECAKIKLLKSSVSEQMTRIYERGQINIEIFESRKAAAKRMQEHFDLGHKGYNVHHCGKHVSKAIIDSKEYPERLK